MLEVKGFPIEREWHIVHWREQTLSAPAEAFRRYLLEFAAEFRGAAVAPVRAAAAPKRARRPSVR